MTDNRRSEEEEGKRTGKIGKRRGLGKKTEEVGKRRGGEEYRGDRKEDRGVMEWEGMRTERESGEDERIGEEDR